LHISVFGSKHRVGSALSVQDGTACRDPGSCGHTGGASSQEAISQGKRCWVRCHSNGVRTVVQEEGDGQCGGTDGGYICFFILA